MDGTREAATLGAGREEIHGGPVLRADAQASAFAAEPERLAPALGLSDTGSRSSLLARLQAAGGNASVGRLIQAAPAASAAPTTHTDVIRYPFTATIRRASSPPPSPAPGGIPSRSDRPPEAGQDAHETAALIEAAPAPQPAAGGPAPAAAGGGTGAPATSAAPTGGSGAGPAPAPAPAQETAGGGAEAPAPAQAPTQATAPATRLPDVRLPELEEVGRCDGLAVVLGYTGSITKGGPTPPGFGETRSFGSSLTNITVAVTPSAYVITAVLEHPITYQIRSGTGPDGQKDIGSDTAAPITAANYSSVVSDLTPNMSDLNGRPPRTSYWAEDLTTKHELVHANDDKGNGPLAMVQVMGWLNGQTVSGPFEVMSVMSQVPKRFAANLLAALSTEAGEKHAYGDGAPSYKARADSIKAKGDKGDYH